MKVMLQKMLMAVLILSLPMFAQQDLKALVLNTIGENVSEVNLTSGAVNSNATTAGLFTNQIRVQDGIAYVVNSGLNEVQIFNPQDYTSLGTIDVGNSTNPWAIEFLTGNEAAVSLLLTDQVAIVDIATQQVITNISVGNGPEGMIFRDGMLYVANSGFNGTGYDPGTVSVIDVASRIVVDTIDVNINPQALGFDSQGRLIVCTTGDFGSVTGNIEIVDVQQGSVVQSIPTGAFTSNIVVSASDKVFAATFGAGVLVYDLNTGTFDRDGTNPLAGGPGLYALTSGEVLVTDFSNDSLFHYASDFSRIGSWLVGDGPVSVAVVNEPVSGIEDQANAFSSFRLESNYPNPFNPTTTIRYELSSAGSVRLDVLDVTGAIVKTLVQDAQAIGTYQVDWDATNQVGNAVTSGLYFYRLIHDGSSVTRKMTLLR
ncbi:MAG: FlgD immunoglobulin-like domain containing protein [Calditrichota bacterium]